MKSDIRTAELNIPNSRAVIVLGVAAFTFLTALGAYMRIPLPFTPVPITMQTFFVLLCAASMGPIYGSASQIGYIALGMAGLPMFTSAGMGLAHLTGPTGGYIIGFLAAQPVVGFIARRGGVQTVNPIRIALAMAAGIVIIYAFGVSHLSMFYGFSLHTAFLKGAAPFLAGDVIKAVSVSVCVLAAKNKISGLI